MSGERRTLQNYAYWSSRKTHESPPGPGPTLDYLQRSSSWWWVYCERCPHYAPMAFAAPVISWGADAPSDKLRQCARCKECGGKARPSSIRHGAATASALCRFLLRVLRSPMSQPCRVELPEDFGKAQKCSETNANKLQHDATRNRSQNSKKCSILLVPGARFHQPPD